MKILISDKIAAKGVQYLKEQGFEVEESFDLSEEKLCEKINEFDALIVRSATKATRKVIEAGEKLKVIGRAGAGTDNIDKEAAKEKGIKVLNTPTGNSLSVAEHALGLTLALLRHIPEGTMSLREGRWEKNRLNGRELTGKTVAIIGGGNIGSRLAKLLIPFKTNTLIVDPFELPKEKLNELNASQVSLNEALEKAEIISVHVPLMNETKNMFSEKEFSKMNGTYLINAARGGIVNEKDLLNALNSGKVAGAALDVFESEPNPNPELLQNKKIIFTPHIASATKEAQDRCGEEIAEFVSKALKKE
ncbi:MAG: hydroxyacid dehydrogenase [Candidatus Diapherotrites archaeon]